MNLTHITNPHSGSHETASRLVSKHGKAKALAHCDKHLVGAMTAIEEGYWNNVKKEVKDEKG